MNKINLFLIRAQWVKDAGWLRIFGYGFAWKNVNIYPLLFSERNKLVKRTQVKNWSFKWLNK